MLEVLGAAMGMVGPRAGETRVEKVPGSYLAAAEGWVGWSGVGGWVRCLHSGDKSGFD